MQPRIFTRSWATVYLPTRSGATRRLSVPVWAALAACVGIPTVAAAAVMLVVGAGPAWLRGQSPVARENAALRATMAQLDRQVGSLSGEVAALAAAHDRLAGVLAVPSFAGAAGPAGPNAGAAPADVDRLLRLARKQRAAYEALLDTFSARATLRARVPSISPSATGWTSSIFGARLDPFTGHRAFHRGLDISLPAGSPVRTTADGTVTAVETQAGLGLLVKIDHGQGLQTVYAHLSSALVRRGQPVRRGTVIALSGNTGRSSAPHLHYEVRLRGQPVNPRPYLLDFPVASR